MTILTYLLIHKRKQSPNTDIFSIPHPPTTQHRSFKDMIVQVYGSVTEFYEIFFVY